MVLFSQMVARSREPIRRGSCYQEMSLRGGTSGSIWSLGREAVSFLSPHRVQGLHHGAQAGGGRAGGSESVPCFTLGPCEPLLHQRVQHWKHQCPLSQGRIWFPCG